MVISVLGNDHQSWSCCVHLVLYFGSKVLQITQILIESFQIFLLLGVRAMGRGCPVDRYVLRGGGVHSGPLNTWIGRGLSSGPLHTRIGGEGGPGPQGGVGGGGGEGGFWTSPCQDELL